MYIERKAGSLERLHIVRDALKMDTTVVVSARYLGSPLDQSALFPALRRVLCEHRALSVQVAPAAEPVFVRLPTVDLARVVQFYPEARPLQSVAKHILMTRLLVGGTDPLWSLHVLPDNTLIFVYHHAIGDGKSGTAFHHSLLTALNQEKHSDVGPSTVVSIPAELGLLPPLEVATDLSVSWFTFLRAVYEMLVPVSWTALSSTYTGRPVSSEKTFDMDIRFLKIPREDATIILKLCKLHKATLTSFLHTVSVVVLSHLVRSLPSDSFTKLRTVIPISLRPYTNAPDTAFCDYISGHSSFVDVLNVFEKHDGAIDPDKFPWLSASAFAQTLAQNAKSSREQIGLLKYVPNLEEFFLGKQGKKRGETLELSNLGRFPFDDNAPMTDPKWSIEDTFFMQSNAVCGSAVKVTVAGSRNGSLGVSFNWTIDAVEDDFAESFVAKFEELVNGIVRQGAPRDLQ